MQPSFQRESTLKSKHLICSKKILGEGTRGLGMILEIMQLQKNSPAAKRTAKRMETKQLCFVSC